jgi:hypothetical protein
MNISDVEPQLAQKLDTTLRQTLQELGYSLPEHWRAQVSLRNSNGRKTRSNAAASNWSPDSGMIEVWFQPAPQQQRSTAEASCSKVNLPSTQPAQLRSESPESVYVHPAEADLLRALHRAESRPGWTFVPLKKFRDEILPSEHLASMRTDAERRNTLDSAIHKKLILPSKVPNPNSPQFPVTTIRVNRLMPEVRAVLGQGGAPDLEFHPVEIRGEPLSTTVLRERR